MMRAEDLTVFGAVDDDGHGITLPRVWVKPKRRLTPETSAGFEVIAFAEVVLGVHLYPWQQWLLVHALELNPDGSYRFRKVIVEVARQNGKTTLMGVLAAWWLFVDSQKHPDKVKPSRFLVVGAAQTLDNAKGPYTTVKEWCNPAPQSDEERDLVIPELSEMTEKFVNTNGEEAIQLKSKARYIVRADKSIRSKSAARVIFDELREQHTDDGWNAVSQTTKAVWSSQLWGISNAGDYRSVTLETQVEKGRKLADGEQGDDTFGFFEWSAPDKCPVDDADAIRQANPSIGYGPMTVDSVRSDIDGMSETSFRTEVLCQWVTADIVPFIRPDLWKAGIDADSIIPDANRVVLAVDTSADRRTSYVAAAGLRADGLPHVELIARRDGMLWVPGYLAKVREKWGVSEVAVQSRGCPAVDFVDPLQEAGWTVHMIEGFRLGACAGRFLDRIREGKLRHLPQPAVEMQASVAVTKRLGEVELWDRQKSALQISGLIAESEALYALETMAGDGAKPKLQPSHNIKIRF